MRNDHVEFWYCNFTNFRDEATVSKIIREKTMTQNLKFSYHGSHVNTIFKFECGETLESCQWIKMKQSLKFARRSHVAIPIPDSLAEEICQN